MSEESEIGWLRLADKSDLVLTERHVFQQRDSGFFGESRTTIQRQAITSVRISWERSRVLLVLGVLLIVMFSIIFVALIIGVPAELARWDASFRANSSFVSFIEYGSLVGGVALLFLFVLNKRNQIQISTSGATLGGEPRSYEEAEQFYTLLVGGLKSKAQTSDEKESETSSRTTATDHDWRL